MPREQQRQRKTTLLIALVVPVLAASVTWIGLGRPALEQTFAAASSTSQTTATVNTVKVNVVNYDYQPSTVTVPAGTTIQWTNNDMVIHSVTSGTSKQKTDLFDTDIAPFGTFSYTFKDPGTYPYYCKYHDMTGTIVVTASGVVTGSGTGSSGGLTDPGSINHGSYGPYGSSQDIVAPLGTGTQGPPLSDGLRLLPYTMQNGYKVFHLTAMPVWWETAKGQRVEAWAYNGSVPGPEIRVDTGDKVKVIVTNHLPEGTTVHWHGLDVPFAQDGSGGDSQADIPPGKSQTYAFNVTTPPGTYIYHAHPMMDMLKQEKLGLSGPFIVEPKGTGWRQTPHGIQQEYTLFLNDSPQFGEIINGKSYPNTPILKAHLGNKIRVHVINMGSLDHPLSLDGTHLVQLAQDGYPLPAPVSMDTIDTQPGTTYDIQVTASNVGTWLLYSSIFDQDSSPDGHLSGMVTTLKVTK